MEETDSAAIFGAGDGAVSLIIHNYVMTLHHERSQEG